MWPEPKEAAYNFQSGHNFVAHRFVYFGFLHVFACKRDIFGENIHFQFRPTPYPLRNISEGSGNINNPSLILPLRKQKTHDGKHFPKQAYAVLHVRRHIVSQTYPDKGLGSFHPSTFRIQRNLSTK